MKKNLFLSSLMEEDTPMTTNSYGASFEMYSFFSSIILKELRRIYNSNTGH